MRRRSRPRPCSLVTLLVVCGIGCARPYDFEPFTRHPDASADGAIGADVTTGSDVARSDAGVVDASVVDATIGDATNSNDVAPPCPSCGPDETCVAGACCPSANACGSVCCGSGTTCHPGGCIGSNEGMVRLTSPFGPSMTNAGVVEVMHEGQWGTICNHGLTGDVGISFATVVCRQLGFRTGNTVNFAIPRDAGTEPVWMDDVDCTRLPPSLIDCAFSGWNPPACTHANDAFVTCQ